MALQAFGPSNEFAPAPSLMGSIEAGAQLGTQLRGQDIAAGEARDRLSLAYAQLQSQEERAAEQAQAKLNLAHATLQARQQQQDLMASFRDRALQQQAERDQERAVQGAQMMDIREKRLKDLDLYRASLEKQREKASAMQEKNLALREAMAKAPRLSETDKALMGADVSELRQVEKKLETTEPSSFVSKVFHLGTDVGSQEITDLKSQALKLRSKIASYEPKERRLALPSSPGAAPAGTPFKEGALIRSKKDGKLYRVKNGEPVPEEQSNADQSE